MRKLYQFLIRPTSNFSSVIRGDSIFGQIVYQLSQKNILQDCLKDYCNGNPPFIVSSLFHSNASIVALNPIIKIKNEVSSIDVEIDRKVLKNKTWCSFDSHEYKINQANLKSLVETENLLFENTLDGSKLVLKNDRTRASINRITNSTDDVDSKPYISREIEIGTQLSFFILIEEDLFGITQLKEVIKELGIFGLGRDGGVGLGKFTLENLVEIDSSSSNFKSTIALSPFVPALEDNIQKLKYRLFTRFGKRRADYGENPFKNPIIFADQFAYIERKKIAIGRELFVGKGLSNITLDDDKIIAQGYSILLPVY